MKGLWWNQTDRYWAVLGVLLLVAVTSCSKEELAAPGHPDAVMQTKATNGAGDSLLIGNNDNNMLAPISDDGDDLGDKERPKPKN